MKVGLSSLSKKERDHVKAQGGKFDQAMQKAMLSVWSNRRMVGLDHIRRPMVIKAALKATGFPVVGYMPPKEAGRPYVDSVDVFQQAFEDAVAAAKGVADGIATETVRAEAGSDGPAAAGNAADTDSAGGAP